MNIQSFLSHFPIHEHTWIFFIVLGIILFAPLLLNKLRIPHIVGMIIAGILIGEYGFNILERDSSFELFGQVGLYYIMFLAGLEMDMESLIKNRNRSLVFGVITLMVPLVMTVFVFSNFLGYSVMAALLLGCILGDHTPIAYPIVGRYGQTGHPTVIISIGSTIVALFISLLILAAIVGSYSGETGWLFWLVFAFKFVAYMGFVMLVYPRITNWFFKHYRDNVMQYIFVLALIFLSAGLAEFAGLEGIFGAFVAGLVLNRQIPALSPLMNRIEFVGNALFIPYFLIGVGMLIDLRILFQGVDVLIIIGVMIFVATLGKWLAAWMVQKIYKMNRTGRLMLFGMTNAHAAGALAIILVGTQLEISPGVFLINEMTLNAMIILILVSCIISSIATEIAAKRLTLSEKESTSKVDFEKENFLITYSNPNTVECLTQIAILLHQPTYKNQLMGLHVITDESRRKQARKTLEHAVSVAASVDIPMLPITKVSTNIASGMIDTTINKEVSDLVIGLHTTKNMTSKFWGELTRDLLDGMHRQVVISRNIVPPSTVNRVVVAVPPNAEFEAGFHKWIDRIGNLAQQVSCPVDFYLNPTTQPVLNNFLKQTHPTVKFKMHTMNSWDELTQLGDVVKEGELMVIVISRTGSISYDSQFAKLPVQVDIYFNHCNLLIMYPDQHGAPECINSYYDPRHHSVHVDHLPRVPGVGRFFSNKTKINS